MAAVIGSSAHSSSYYLVYSLQPSARNQPAVKTPDTDLKASMTLSIPLPNTVYTKDIPQPISSFLSQIEKATAGDTLKTWLDKDSLAWFKTNFDVVTEMHRGKWELTDKSAIITIPTLIHESFLHELTCSLGKRTNPRKLKIGATSIPVYDRMKIPDISIYNNHYKGEGYGFPTVSIEVSYSESHTKLLWDIIRLVLGLQEVIPCVFNGSGILDAADAKTFKHEKVYGRKSDDGNWKIVLESEPGEFKKFRILPLKGHKDQTFIDCELVHAWKITEHDQVDIIVPRDVLFCENKSNGKSLVISPAHLWECCNKNSHMNEEVKEGTLEIKGNGVLGKRKFSKVGTQDLRGKHRMN
ncbi:hypothetical protein IW262DRAFT_1549235 [Armillaria fumosa]|nr:hypothetical protein IW262DRAFT_1549235 [Armillaria fumosa]